MRLYFVRHGETDWNVGKRLQGRTDIPLNQKGVDLAKATGRALRDVPFSRAFTSPLRRAFKTAELILEGREVPIIPDRRIIEIAFGEYEGLCTREEGFEIPDPGFLNFFHNPSEYQPPEGGESFEELMARTREFIQDITAREEWEEERILITTHGAAVRGLLNAVDGTGVSDFWHGSVPKNCSVAIVESRQGKLRLIQENKVYWTEERL